MKVEEEEEEAGTEQALARKLRSIKDIPGMTQMNGLPIEEIERRSIPLIDRTAELMEYVDYVRCRSSCGFLDAGQSLKQVLIEDWKIVLSEGTSHIALATHLRNILTKVETERSTQRRGPDTEITIPYTAPDLSGNTQQLRVTHRSYLGDQWSLFYNKAISDQETEKWKEDYKIYNDHIGLSINVAGGLKGGIINYIENYGFYEGGLSNEYRIHPLVLIAVLTGKVDHRVKVIQMDMIDKKIGDLEKEKMLLIAEWRKETELLGQEEEEEGEQSRRLASRMKVMLEEMDCQILSLKCEKSKWN